MGLGSDVWLWMLGLAEVLAVGVVYVGGSRPIGTWLRRPRPRRPCSPVSRARPPRLVVRDRNRGGARYDQSRPTTPPTSPTNAPTTSPTAGRDQPTDSIDVDAVV